MEDFADMDDTTVGLLCAFAEVERQDFTGPLTEQEDNYLRELQNERQKRWEAREDE